MTSRLVPRRRLASCLAFVALGCTVVAGGVRAQPLVRHDADVATVLLLQFGVADGLENQQRRTAIEAALRANTNRGVEIYPEILRAERLEVGDATKGLVEYIRTTFRGRKIDLVVADHGLSMDFALQHRAELFPEAPLVVATYLHIDPALRAAGAGLAGVERMARPAATAQLALHLHPEIRRFLLVLSAPSAPLTAGVRSATISGMQRAVPGTEVRFIEARTTTQLVEQVRAAPDDSVILFVEYFGDDNDNLLRESPFAEGLVAREARVPVYGSNGRHIGSGVVGGVICDQQLLGTRVGTMASAILNGASPDSIPVEAATCGPVMDQRAMLRWHIDPSRLPPDAQLRYATPTLWQQYRWLLIGSIAFLLLQAALIVGLLVQRTRRRLAEDVAIARESALRQSYVETRHLAGRLVSAQEEERTRIARELHDDIGQRMASLCIGLSRAKRAVLDDAGDEFGRLRDQAMGLSADLRRLSHDLHPGTLEHVGLATTLRARVDEVSAESGIGVHLHVSADWPSRLSGDAALCFYRVAQEALRNVTRHAHAQTASVTLVVDGDMLVMRIVDDGRGFEAGARESQGLGIASMTERVRMLGGHLELRSASGGGTVLTVSLPRGT
jgi:signal transduction histidine kinase